MDSFFIWLASVVWFLLPAAASNTIPPVAAKLLPRWEFPLDCYQHWRGQRVLGSHKTLRGLLFGIVFATLVHQLQCELALESQFLRTLAVDPQFYQWWLGPWLGFLALFGDALKSFLKRQVHIAPGQGWFPWDQIDWILASFLGTWFLFDFQLWFVFSAVMLGMVLSFTAHLLGYLLGINSEWH